MTEGACVGREPELSRLRRLVARAARGSGGLVLVQGVAGIGKSTLAGQAMVEASALGGCAYRVVAHRSAASPVGLFSRLAEAAAAAGTPPPALEPATQLHPHARYAAALALVQRLGPAPVVVVVDDLQWADESSAALLAQLAPALAATSVLVVATWRGPITAEPPPALEGLAPWADTIVLGPLGIDGVREMAMLAAGEQAADWAHAVAPVLTDVSRGNPLVLSAILDDLGVAEGARPSPSEITSTGHDRAVAEVLARRLDNLSDAATELVEVVALLGGDAPPTLLGDVLERDPRDDIDAATQVGVVEPRPDGTVAFAHPVLAELATARLPESRARPLHVRIADVLRRRGRARDLIAVAQHLAAAGPLVEPERLRTVALDAGAQALRTGDHASAARCFDLALDACDPDDRIELLLRASTAHRYAGHRELAWSRAREAAALAGDARADDLARAALELARHRRYTTDPSDAVALLHRALAVLHGEHPLRGEILGVCAMLEIAMPMPAELRSLDNAPGGAPDDGDRAQTSVAWDWLHRVEGSRAMADEALALARASGDGDALAKASAAWRQTHCAPERLAERLRLADVALASARAPEARAHAAIASVLDNLEVGRRAQVDRAMTELVGLSAATGDPTMRWRTGQLAAMLAFASGDVSAARRHLRDAFVHGTQAGENGRWVVRTVQATMLSVETDEDLSATADFVLEAVDQIVYPPIRAGAVRALVFVGHVDHAARYVDELVQHVTTDADREASWLVTASFVADVVAQLGLVDAAKALLPVVLPFADHVAVDGIGFHCAGSLARPLARLADVLGDDDLAASLATTARERDTGAGLHLTALDGALDDLARRAAAGAIDGSDLRARAGAIADDATERGLLRLARRARALQRPTTGQELTSRQRDVLHALAEGLTYQAAAEQLGFSHSTIRHEAMRIYAALGAADREEAVRIARRVGLLPA